MGYKVFVVDDNPKNIRLLQEILEDESYEVHSFENGLSLVALSKELKPDVILLDIMMPEKDGFQVCRELKQDPETRDIPVLMVTAKAEGTDVKRALEIGAFDYLKKPIHEVEVVARIQSALRFKEDQDRLRELAMKDSLTGLFNHASLMELLEKEWVKAERNLAPYSYAMLDVDFFKRINDTYGHAAGDRILQELARVLLGSVRKGDIVGRYGGEEFGLILPGASGDQARQLCERIRIAIAEYRFFYEKDLIPVTVSIGACAWTPDLREVKELAEKADQMLYQAKANGRNQVSLAGP